MVYLNKKKISHWQWPIGRVYEIVYKQKYFDLKKRWYLIKFFQAGALKFEKKECMDKKIENR